MWLRRAPHRKRSRDRGRGAAAVETALIFPLLIALTFGLLEFSLFWNTDHTFNEAARSGARIGATKARELNYDDLIVAAVEDRLKHVDPTTVRRLTIYNANPVNGDPLSGTVTTCTIECYRYTWNAVTKSFVPVTGTEWAAADQAACGQLGHNDYIGVYVEGIWSSPSGLFGTNHKVSETSILRLEPVPLTGLCE